MSLPASGSRHSIGLVPELAYAVTPATPVFAAVRHNSTTLALAIANVKSSELRPDRQVSGFRHTTRSVAGDIVSDITYGGTFDTLLSMALMGAWNVNVLKSGVLRPTATIERAFTDVGQYLRFRGAEISKLAVKVAPGTLSAATFSFMANDADPMAQVPVTGATYTVPTTTDPMNGISGMVKEAGVVYGLISAIDFTLDNGMKANMVIGQANGIQSSVSTSDCSGTITVYFADAILYNKFVNETPSQLEFTLNDLAGNSYDFLLGNVKYNASPIPVSNDGSITMQITFQALLDSAVSGTNLQITRTPHS
jgi:hypothetical protein